MNQYYINSMSLKGQKGMVISMKIKGRMVLLLSLIFSISLIGCSPKDKGEQDTTPKADSVESTPSKEPTVESPSPDTAEETLSPEEEFEQIVNVTIPAPSLENNMIEEAVEQDISIYLPKNYASNEKNYPVLYFLPGFGDSQRAYIEMFKSNMESIEKEGKNMDMIVVSINGNNKLGGSFYVNSPVIGNWEDFVTKDVVQYIDSNYRTIKEPNGRGIAGHSMGGFGVYNIVFHTNDIFCAAYSMSPGVFDKNGRSKSSLNLDLLAKVQEDYKDMDPDAAKTAYLETCDTRSWPANFTFAYGSAFAYDSEGKAPYIKIPSKNKKGEYKEDEIMALYDSGYGNVPEKLDTYKDNLLKLKGFTIEYGVNDDFAWIPEGCKYFSEELKKRDIPHELVEFDGDHQSQVMGRILRQVLPFFAEIFELQ